MLARDDNEVIGLKAGCHGRRDDHAATAHAHIGLTAALGLHTLAILNTACALRSLRHRKLASGTCCLKEGNTRRKHEPGSNAD